MFLLASDKKFTYRIDLLAVSTNQQLVKNTNQTWIIFVYGVKCLFFFL